MSNKYEKLEKLKNGRINLRKLEENKTRYLGEDFSMKYIYKYKGENVYFKSNHEDAWNDYAEVYFYHLAKELGIDALEYKLSSSGEEDGVISFEFKKPGEKEMCFNEFIARTLNENIKDADFNYVSRAIDFNRKYKFTEGKIETKKKLLNSILFDAVIMNDDRHSANIVFLVDNKNNIRLAPLFDHGLSAGIIDAKDYADTDRPYNKKLDVSDDNIFKYDYNSDNTTDDIFKLFRFNRNTVTPFFKKYFDIDFSDLANKIEKEEGIVFPKRFKKYVSVVLNFRKKVILYKFKEKIKMVENSHDKSGLKEKYRELGQEI